MRLCLLLACLLSFRMTYAQSLNKEVETTIDNLNAAMISKDKPILEKLTTEELSYGHSTGVVQNKSEFVNDILSGPINFLKIDITNENINLADDIAIVRNISSISGTNKGMPLELKIGVLMIWKKQEGNWKLLARQGFKLP
ncbi:MAG TPA: nuclear transport factor 2 family protein [Puia sp.]